MMNVHQRLTDREKSSVICSDPNNIMVVAEHPVIVEGIKCILQTAMPDEIISSSHSIAAAKESICSASPDIIIIDTIFGKTEILDFIYWVREFDSEIKILILADDSTDKFCVEAFKCGARGCFFKDSSPEKISYSLQMVLEGRILLDEGFLHALITMGDLQEESLQYNFKPRDIQILHLVAQGHTNQAISDKIFISNRTVQGRLSKIFSVLGVKTRTEAVSKALRLGILKQDCLSPSEMA